MRIVVPGVVTFIGCMVFSELNLMKHRQIKPESVFIALVEQQLHVAQEREETPIVSIDPANGTSSDHIVFDIAATVADLPLSRWNRFSQGYNFVALRVTEMPRPVLPPLRHELLRRVKCFRELIKLTPFCQELLGELNQLCLNLLMLLEQFVQHVGRALQQRSQRTYN